MAQVDTATVFAAKGYVYIAPVGTAKPTPAAIAAFDADNFGSQVQELAITGAPTGGTFTLTVDGETTAAIAYNATGDQVEAALAALTNVGLGNVKAEGVQLPTGPIEVTWTGALQGQELDITHTDSLTGGTTPAVTVTETQAVSGWKTIGHTSREEMPEFGYDGGDKELKGSWQNPKLRRVQTDPYEDYVTLQLLQFTTEALKLYYGSGTTAGAGYLDVNEVDNVSNEYALLIVIVDGNEKLAFHSLKADVCRDEAISVPVDDLAALPIKATFLQISNQPIFSWISEEITNT